VDAEVAGDTYMPPFDLGAWREVSSLEYPADAHHAYPFRFAIYERFPVTNRREPPMNADERG